MLFGTQPDSDVRVSNINPSDHDIAFSLTMDGHTRQYTVPSPADFMAFNAAAAAAWQRLRGLEKQTLP